MDIGCVFFASWFIAILNPAGFDPALLPGDVQRPQPGQRAVGEACLVQAQVGMDAGVGQTVGRGWQKEEMEGRVRMEMRRREGTSLVDVLSGHEACLVQAQARAGQGRGKDGAGSGGVRGRDEGRDGSKEVEGERKDEERSLRVGLGTSAGNEAETSLFAEAAEWDI